MHNRINKHPATKHSKRYNQERQARLHALRDPAVTAMYQSREWQLLRARVRRDAEGKCQWPSCISPGLCVDHKQPHKGNRGLFFSRGNVWLLCKTHHDRKTAKHDGGFGNDAKPLTWPFVGPR
jgi:5-methylcytosine-specific restriction protein A